MIEYITYKPYTMSKNNPHGAWSIEIAHKIYGTIIKSLLIANLPNNSKK